jgi:hypothetical protein
VLTGVEDGAHSEYGRRLEVRRAVSSLEYRQHVRIGNARLAVVAAAAVVAWLSLWRDVVSPWWLLIPGVVFSFLVFLHERVLRAKRVADRAVAFYESRLGYLEDRWSGKGEPGERFRDPAHPYSEDLDLFGKGSLFELLCTARTRIGEATLARWLLAPASPNEVRARQAAVTELRAKLDFREDLAVLGEDVRAGVRPEELAAWGEGAPLLDSRAARIGAVLLAGAGVASVVLAIWLDLPSIFVITAFFEAVFTFRYRARVKRVIESVELAAHDLDLLAQVLRRLEREPAAAPRLAELTRALQVDGRAPSERIARLDRLMELVDSREHVLMRAIGPLILWTTQLAFAVESWRKISGPAVRRWLDAVGEMEALSALAGFAYEHPADPFPEIIEDGACFEAEGLGHPLIPVSKVIRNDVRLGGELRVLMVSGSNMSGKSTLLRSVGANTVLAMAGAPVRADRLRLSPLAVGASIRLVDSLHGGVSRFYAQITRLHQLVEISRGPIPLLFLLDELLHGTNSHDRRIGAQAVVRGLAEQGAIGMVTTHDLALAEIVDGLGAAGANVHFEDQFEDGRMSFDYRLRPGVIRKSNALELMRSVGLRV